MDISELSKYPVTLEVNGREGCFTLSHDSPGWIATYMFYDFDILDSEYYPTPEEALTKLSEKLKNIRRS